MPRKKRQRSILNIKSLIYLIGGLIICVTIQNTFFAPSVDATSCPDVKIIFVRGSGATRYENSDYQSFKSALVDKLSLIDLTYEFDDLDYPAVGVGINNLWTALGAYFGAGNAYDFGDSVNRGVEKLTHTVDSECSGTKYVLAGYSQGAMVVSKALSFLDPERIIYAATFGDPKIYLPEGKATLATNLSGTSDKNGLRTGLIPPACKGIDLSNYRAYVPDCYAYEGLLGSYRPYQPEGFQDKLGTWCNKFDIFCSSYYGVSSHVSYVSDGLYEDASKLIFAKIANTFGVEHTYTSKHDTAILIDSTWSMNDLIEQYKSEALKLASKTFASGGRVALYDYRDLIDPYDPVEHCNFETCTMEIIESELNAIEAVGGEDTPESLLSASFTTMNKLSWSNGSTKSIVILTDAGFHSPDLDGTTFADVVGLSKRIDPVNFYIITTPETVDEYYELAEATGGLVTTSVDDLSLLTDTIMSRFDSLPKVEELDVDSNGAIIINDEFPELEIIDVEDGFGDSIVIKFRNSGIHTLVVLNDAVLGLADENCVVIEGLDRSIQNHIRLIPLSENRRGEAVNIEVGVVPNHNVFVPKAPDTSVFKGTF